MNYHCWRNSISGVADDSERTWPKLPHSALEETQNGRIVLQPRISNVNDESAGRSQADNSHKGLNAIEYPKLGETGSKRKKNLVDQDRSEMRNDILDSDARRLRRLKSTDSIQINLQKMLENHKWPLFLQSTYPTKITIDVCKLNVNMRMEAAPDNKMPIQKLKQNPICVLKKKKLSRLKWLILYERMSRRASNEIRSIREPEEDLASINFDGLKINSVKSEETELEKKMSTLTCLDRKYRETREIRIGEDTVTFHPDLHEKMESLALEKAENFTFEEDKRRENVISDVVPIDCEAMNAALSLEICDETGESNENVGGEQLPGRINYSRRFREYCTNTLTPDLTKHLREFMAEISRLQKKMYDKDNVKGRSKRRYYGGIKEVQKHVDLKKIKFLVVAPDIERVKIEGGLDDMVGKLIGSCKRNEVPYCFGLDRRKLGYYVHGKGIVSCIGIANYSGAEEKLKNVLLEVVEARNEFARLVGDEAKTIDVHKLLPQDELLLSEIINAYLKILANNS